MKKSIILIIVMLCISSCKSLRLRTHAQLNDVNNIIKYDFNDFYIYTFNICEEYEAENLIERFADCPEDFYDVAEAEKKRKVEELYLLKHKKTDLVLYLTTVSHKYISKKQRGFLNDPKHYKNNIVLDQIESIYIGKYDSSRSIIHFPSQKDKKDIILHFDSTNYPEMLWLKQANVATAENNYDTSEPIKLDSVFKQQIKYHLKENYTMHYYRGTNMNDSTKKHKVDSIYLTSKDGKIQANFSLLNFDYYYQMRNKRVKYHPNFYLIQ